MEWRREENYMRTYVINWYNDRVGNKLWAACISTGTSGLRGCMIIAIWECNGGSAANSCGERDTHAITPFEGEHKHV